MVSKPGLPARTGGGLNRQKSLASEAGPAPGRSRQANATRCRPTPQSNRIEISLFVRIDLDVRARIDKNLIDKDLRGPDRIGRGRDELRQGDRRERASNPTRTSLP